MRRRAGKSPAANRSAQAHVNLILLLNGATDERVASFTVDYLARCYAVDRREIEVLLLAAQDKRRRAAVA